MKLDLLRHDTERSRELALGHYWVGGASTDDILFPGAPPSLVELRVETCREGTRAIFTARETVCVNGVFVPPNLPRLLLPGETLELGPQGALRLSAVPTPPEATHTVALLRGLAQQSVVTNWGRAANVQCLTGLDMGRRYPLSDAPTELGRGETADIRLRDRAVSRRHARLRKCREGYVLEDLGSPNGVFVDGQRVDGSRPLQDGAILELGCTLLRFAAPLDDAPPSALPTTRPTSENHAGTSNSDVSQSPGETSPVAEAQPRQLKLPPSVFELSILALGGLFALAGGWVALALVAG